jgi:hypothetical protein
MPTFIDEPVILDAFRFWDSLRRGRPVPERKDIDPLDIPKHLFPHLALIEIHDQGSRVRFRLLGENLIERFGLNRVGVFFDEFISGSYLEYTKSYYRDLYRHRRPVFSASRFRSASGWECLTKRLVMPLTTGSDEVTMAFAAQTFASSAAVVIKATASVLDDLDVEEVSRNLVSV